jgi:hypothetical protein
MLWFIYEQRPDTTDFWLHTGLGASCNWVTYFTTDRGRSVNTQYHHFHLCKGHTPDLGKLRTGNTTWRPCTKVAWGKCEHTCWNRTTCKNNMVVSTCETVQFGDFLQFIVSWWWPCGAETCCNEWHFMTFKCNYERQLKWKLCLHLWTEVTEWKCDTNRTGCWNITLYIVSCSPVFSFTLRK